MKKPFFIRALETCFNLDGSWNCILLDNIFNLKIKLHIRATTIFEAASKDDALKIDSIIKVKMEITPEHNQRMANLIFASVYPLYLKKIESKGRTKQELHQVIEWLTGFDEQKLQKLMAEHATFERFFNEAKLNPNASLIKGVICGYRIEDIDNSLTRQVRYLDKLVDELAKGKKMEKILRT